MLTRTSPALVLLAPLVACTGQTTGDSPVGDAPGEHGDAIGGGGDTLAGDHALSGDEDLPACSLTISVGDSFTQAFAQLAAGETLCLNDGTYNQAMDIPSAIHVRAVHDGGADIDGGGTLGEEWSGGLLQMHGDGSSVRGLRVHHAGTNSDACDIGGTDNTMRVTSCAHGGAHEHKVPLKLSGSGHLVEDSWFFGEGRYVVQCFVGRDITLRRNVARWDSTAPDEPTEPNAAFSIYNCSDVTIENNISLDYGVPETPMDYGGDFYGPQNASVWPEGSQNNHWLGNFAINHALATNNRRGLRLDPATVSNNNVVTDFYVRGNGSGIVGNSRTASLVVGTCTMVDVDSTGTNAGLPVTCTGEADTQHRYVDRVKTAALLFPWRNQGMIKADMCRAGERQSDWCVSDQSLSAYVLGL